MISKYMA